MSHFYELKAAVRQGGVLSPTLFGIYIDGLVKLVDKTNTGCKIGVLCTAIFLYADDIILIAPSIQALQSLIRLCELELNFACMTVNVKKSACLRFGPRYNKNSIGDEIANVNFLRRYGTYVLQNTKKENLLRLTN